MTVKIVDEKPDASVVRNAICGKCGVKLEYVPVDVRSEVHHDYGGGSDTFYFIECPRCGHKQGAKP